MIRATSIAWAWKSSSENPALPRGATLPKASAVSASDRIVSTPRYMTASRTEVTVEVRPKRAELASWSTLALIATSRSSTADTWWGCQSESERTWLSSM